MSSTAAVEPSPAPKTQPQPSSSSSPPPPSQQQQQTQPQPPESSSSPKTSFQPSPTRSPISTPPPVVVPQPSTTASRRLPPPCWTHEETLALIDSYGEKWYALRRGNLRAPHWQEVADDVGQRCERLPTATPKTAVQCRHKMEKLRKRYRSEKQRALTTPNRASSWVYFRKMDLMEQGSNSNSASIPITVAAVAAPLTVPAAASYRISPPSPPSSSEEDEDEVEDPRSVNQARNIHRIMVNGAGSNAFSGLQFTVPKAVRSRIAHGHGYGHRQLDPGSEARFYFKGYSPGEAAEEMRRVEKKRKREKGKGMTAAGEVAAVLRALGDGFLRVEQMKMEMARELEKARMEMEIKRTEMIVDAQRRLVNTFVEGVCGKKQAKLSF